MGSGVGLPPFELREGKADGTQWGEEHMCTGMHVGECIHAACTCPGGWLDIWVASRWPGAMRGPGRVQLAHWAGGLMLTGVHKLLLHALLALHVATPLHLAVAGEGHQAALGVVAPPTA